MITPARPRARSLAIAAALTLACNGAASSPAASGTPTPTPSPVSEATESGEATAPADANTPSPTTASGRLLVWLDPDAVGATWVAGRSELDADALTTVFAIPPRASRMLTDLQNVDEGLAIVFGDDAPRTWMRPEALAMLPAMARATYVLRLLAVPRAQIEDALRAADWEPGVIEGFTAWEPTGAFPWRLVFLDDEAIALIPVHEIGSGIGPLTAARDLPAGALRTELSKAVVDPELMLELFAQGPLLHIDLTDDVGIVRLSLRRWQHSGIDANVLMQSLGDPVSAAAELEARKAPLESDAIQDLVGKVAFTADSGLVLGRLQLPAEDLGALRRRTR